MDYTLVKDSAKREYKRIKSGTCYHVDTPDEVIKILEDNRIMHYARQGVRLRFVFGDVKTGKSWEEVYDVTGQVGRSTGNYQIPLLINNSRSMGGGGLLDHCIIGIRHANRKNGGYIYRHPLYKGNE